MVWQDVLGFCDFEDLYQSVVNKFSSGTLVEIGTAFGRSLCMLGTKAKESGKDFHIIGVDWCTCPFEKVEDDPHSSQYTRGTFAGTLYANILDCGLKDIITLLVAPSVRAASMFNDKSLDFVFIDAQHEYDPVYDDVTAWFPKVKPGGWLAGHDYNKLTFPSLIQAVSELLPDAKPVSKQCWLYEVPL